ncbi:uncharacterized protein LOC142322881 [Lycorma delicatula]|uniref:uncharacterized protein LOC142322881 n=1 Tax=Lycorma delicatula TaxID=130591 RepID=UPI003F517C2E
MSVEDAVTYLENAVKTANSELDYISRELDKFDIEVLRRNIKVPVIFILDRMAQVKEEYEQLKCEILELEELERTVHQSLMVKAMNVQHRMIALHTKIKPHDQYGLH